jgi:hypothetical protein
MDFVTEILQRVKNLWGIMMNAKDQGIALVKAALPELPAAIKKYGKRMGIWAFVMFIGLGILGVAALYGVYALILVVDLAFERMWLSAVVVVGAMALCGGIAAIIGGIATYESAVKLQKQAEPVVREAGELVVSTAQETYGEVTGLWGPTNQLMKLALHVLGLVKRAAPVLSALALASALIWRHHRRRKRLLAWTPRVIEEVTRMAGLPPVR